VCTAEKYVARGASAGRNVDPEVVIPNLLGSRVGLLFGAQPRPREKIRVFVGDPAYIRWIAVA